MKIYSPAEEPLDVKDEVSEKPAPYNWLAILLILVAYIVFVVIS